MSYQSVDVFVRDHTPAGLPVEGLLVRVFDAANKVFYTEASTDEYGRAGFTLFTGTYNLRFYKFGAQVKQPQQILVLAPETGDVLINQFDVTATVFLHPVANDPRLCRASGYFRDITGAPHANLDIHLMGQFAPILLDGAGVMSERRAVRTDSNGFACVDLIRCGQYEATVQGFEDTQRLVDVPDAPSVNLPDLLFPVVQGVTFAEDVPFTVSVGSSIELTPTVTASNGVPLEGAGTGDVRWFSSDETVLGVVATRTKIVLTGRAKGSAELRAERRDVSIVRIPKTSVTGVPQGVTVT